jgi:hypothetical protein
MGLWEQLLDRFVPALEDDVSWLDRRDGVAGAEPVQGAGSARWLTADASTGA